MGFGLLALGYIFLNFYTTGADLIGYIIMLFALLKLVKVEKSFKKSVIAVCILIPVGMFNLLGFCDEALHLNILRDYSYQNPVFNMESSESGLNSVESENVSEEQQTSSKESVISEETIVSDSEKSESDKTENSSNEKDEKRKRRTMLLEVIFNSLFIFGSLCFHYFFYQSARKLAISTSAVKLANKASRNMIINIVFFSAWGFITAGGSTVAVLTAVSLLHFPLLIFNFIYIYSCYATFTFESEDTDSSKE